MADRLYVKYLRLGLDRSSSSISQHEEEAILEFVKEYSEPVNHYVIMTDHPLTLFIDIPIKRNDYFNQFKKEWINFQSIADDLLTKRYFRNITNNNIFSSRIHKSSLSVVPPVQDFKVEYLNSDKTQFKASIDKNTHEKFLLSPFIESPTLLDHCYIELLKDYIDGASQRLCAYCEKVFVEKNKNAVLCLDCKGIENIRVKVSRKRHPQEYREYMRLHMSKTRKQSKKNTRT